MSEKLSPGKDETTPYKPESLMAVDYKGEILDALTLARVLEIPLEFETSHPNRLTNNSWVRIFQELSSHLWANPIFSSMGLEEKVQIIASANRIVRLTRYGLED